MQTRTVDVAIIGAGTAGLNARRAAEAEGASVVMIDPGPYGTTCARVGCMPSKLLIAAADAVHSASEGGVFGFSADVTIDGRAVMARVRRERDRFAGFVVAATQGYAENGQLISGRARFTGPTTMVVDGGPEDGTTIHFTSAVIATGSTPWTPPPFRALSGRVLMDNEGLFDLTDLPESVLVVGTGVIGLELGQALHRLGVRTTLVGVGGQVGPLQDPRMQQKAMEIFSAELDLHPDYRLVELRESDAGVFARWTNPDGAEHEGTYEKVLVAAGRTPNVRGIGLDTTGADLNERGAPTQNLDTLQLPGTAIFMAGDVTNDRPLLHEASDEGRFAGTNAANYPDVVAHPRRVQLAVVFTDPQIAVVGDSFSLYGCDSHRVGEIDYGDQGRARVMNRNKGLVRIYGELETGQIKGAEMIGPGVEHTSHLLAWAVQQSTKVNDALGMPFYHPVVEEGIRTALRDLRTNLGVERPKGTVCEDFGPGQ